MNPDSPATYGGSSHVQWTPPPVEALRVLLPQYEIIAMIGRGGMGAVYKGRQRSLDRLVAIKLLPPDISAADGSFIERFKNEARTMARLNHPGIVGVHEFGETADGQFYFVMEHVDGSDLARVIAESGKLAPEKVSQITIAVCDALAYAHANGVVHRDIKPANILINTQGQVKVADFGLAKVDASLESGALTRTGLAMGTPEFVAPEALIMGVHVDGRADLYAVGVMLYQMLTGEIPRGLFIMPGLQSKGAIDTRFDRVITKAMQSRRESRYQTAGELRKDIDVILTTANMRQDTASQEPGTRSKKPVFIGLAAMLAIIGSVVFFLNDTSSGDAATSGGNTVSLPSAPSKGGEKIEHREIDAAPAVSAGDGQVWQDFIAGLDRASPGLPSNCQLDGMSLRIGGDKADTELRIAAGSFRDAALRATVRGGGSDLILNLRHEQTNDKIQARIEHNGVVTMNYWHAEAKTELAKITLPASFVFGDRHTVEFRAQGDRLTLVLDGEEVLVGHPSAVTSGRISLRADPGAVFEKIEWCELPAPTHAIGDAGRTATAGAPAEFAGHRYQFVPDPTLLWSEAKVKAEAMGGHLVTITSQEENDWIARTFIQALPVDRGVWIGGMRGKGGLWHWVTGEPFQFQNWLPVENVVGEPAPLFMHFRQRGLGWVDTPYDGIVGQNKDRDFRAGYLVEWDDAQAVASGAGTLWMDGLAEWWRLPKGSGEGLLTREPGGSRVKERNGIFMRNTLPGANFKDVTFRVTVKDTSEYTSLYARMTGAFETVRSYHAVLWYDGTTKIGFNDGQPGGKELKRFAVPPRFVPGGSHTFEFRVEGDLLSIAIDGDEIGSVRNSELQMGQIYLTADPGALIEKLEYRELRP